MSADHSLYIPFLSFSLDEIHSYPHLPPSYNQHTFDVSLPEFHEIILTHNHPSGNLKPSEADIHLTKKLKEASLLFDINLADHIIFTNHGFYSMSDQNIL